jgi:glucose/arabinose dehydrogenase
MGQPIIQLQPVSGGFSRPLLVTHAGDSSGRLFVLEQMGRIRIIDSTGNLLPTDFLNLGDTPGGLNRVSQAGGETGLLGMAFHPDYAGNGRFFVSYTRVSDGASVIEEFQVSADPNVADASSGTVVYGPIAQPQANHNGGHICFHPTDGYLYYGMGDGGGGGDGGEGHTAGIGNGQDPSNPLGTILRLDADNGFTAPPSNPYFGIAGFLDEIYAYGLRNPWRFSFDRAAGHRLFCADVGQDAVEEIDIVGPGDNLGWRRMEGSSCYNPSTGCQTGDLVLPIHEYGHTTGCISVTGGYVYRGTQFPNMVGKYFFADYCTGQIWYLEETSPGFFAETLALETGFRISSFGEDEEGELYVCEFNGAQQIYRLIDVAPNSINVTVSLAAELVVSVTPTAWNIGALSIGQSVGPQTINAAVGNIPTLLEVNATESAGGWKLGDFAAMNQFAVQVADPAITLSTTFQVLDPSLGPYANRDFDLTYLAPSADTLGAGVDQIFDITIKGSPTP